MDSPYPVDANQFPQVMKDAPYKYEGALDYDQPMLDKSLPVEVRDALGAVTAPDPFNRYSPQQAARRILIEGEHPPIKGTWDPRISSKGVNPNAIVTRRRGPGGSGMGGAVSSKAIDDAWGAVRTSFKAISAELGKINIHNPEVLKELSEDLDMYMGTSEPLLGLFSDEQDVSLKEPLLHG